MAFAELAGLLFGCYAVMVVGLALFQRGMIYRPNRSRVEPAEVGLDRMVPVPVRARDGWVVTGWYAPPSDPRAATIVFCHGNSGSIAGRARKAKAFLEVGYGLYMVGYRGFGGNPGRPSEAGLYADARAAMTWLTTRGLHENRLVLYGESLGAAVALQMALEHPETAGLVLECPFTRLSAMAPPYLLPGIADMLVMDRFDNLEKIPALAVPLLVIHGLADTLVPVQMGRQLVAAAQCPKDAVYVEGAGHNDTWDEGGENAVFDFLAKRVPS